MRRFVIAMVMAAVARNAFAADLPDLTDLPVLRGSLREGPSSSVNWEGLYVGGQAGYGAADMDFTGSNSAMTSRVLANTVIENDMQVSQWPLFIGKSSQRHSAFGGFAGYNAQWDDAVLGLEVNYMHGEFNGASSASTTLISGSALSDNNYHLVTSASSAAMQITDFGTVRARAGWAYGNFLPYAFGGVALGNANITRSVLVSDQYGATPDDARAATASVRTTADALHNHLIYGYSAGLGLDMMLFGNIFGRVEWEYIRFTGAIDTNVNTVRAGLGYKF